MKNRARNRDISHYSTYFADKYCRRAGMRIYHTGRGTSGYLHGESIYRADLPNRPFSPFFFHGENWNIFPASPPDFIVQFLVESFIQRYDRFAHSWRFVRECAANVPVSSLRCSLRSLSSAFKSFRFWNFWSSDFLHSQVLTSFALCAGDARVYMFPRFFYAF